jgi:hypothetical protein
MPSFNRRGFLQLLGAAGLTPLLPSLPARAVATSASASTSKALWAGIYANSGSVPKFLSVARNMGLSNSAIQGVSARSVGVRVALTAATNPITKISGSSKTTWSSSTSPQADPLNAARDIMHKVKRALPVETAETPTFVDEETETLSQPNVPDGSKTGTS